MSRYYFFLEGINNDLANVEGWHLRAERWIERNTPDKADSYPYSVHALTRFLKQAKHTKWAFQCLTEGWMPSSDLVLVGHSNGCDLICRMLKEYPAMKALEVHLIAAATYADFDHNGLNDAVARNQIGRLILYCSKSDRALKLAKESYPWISKFFSKLGYGSLGLTGYEKASADAERVTLVKWKDGYDHSTYFEGDHFELTMAEITAGYEVNEIPATVPPEK